LNDFARGLLLDVIDVIDVIDVPDVLGFDRCICTGALTGMVKWLVGISCGIITW
jgi:hypothetical protein